MIPGGVIANIGIKERFHVGELLRRIPESEVPDQPVAVRPDVVVLRVLFEHRHQEGGFASWEGWEVLTRGDEDLAVVPFFLPVS